MKNVKIQPNLTDCPPLPSPHLSLWTSPRSPVNHHFLQKQKYTFPGWYCCKCFEILRKKYWEANLGFRAAYECLAAVKLRMTNRLSFNIHFTLSSSLSNIFRWENRFHKKTVWNRPFWTWKIWKLVYAKINYYNFFVFN